MFHFGNDLVPLNAKIGIKQLLGLPKCGVPLPTSLSFMWHGSMGFGLWALLVSPRWSTTLYPSNGLLNVTNSLLVQWLDGSFGQSFRIQCGISQGAFRSVASWWSQTLGHEVIGNVASSTLFGIVAVHGLCIYFWRLWTVKICQCKKKCSPYDNFRSSIISFHFLVETIKWRNFGPTLLGWKRQSLLWIQSEANCRIKPPSWDKSLEVFALPLRSDANCCLIGKNLNLRGETICLPTEEEFDVMEAKLQKSLRKTFHATLVAV